MGRPEGAGLEVLLHLESGEVDRRARARLELFPVLAEHAFSHLVHHLYLHAWRQRSQHLWIQLRAARW